MCPIFKKYKATCRYTRILKRFQGSEIVQQMPSMRLTWVQMAHLIFQASLVGTAWNAPSKQHQGHSWGCQALQGLSGICPLVLALNCCFWRGWLRRTGGVPGPKTLLERPLGLPPQNSFTWKYKFSFLANIRKIES